MNRTKVGAEALWQNPLKPSLPSKTTAIWFRPPHNKAQSSGIIIKALTNL